MKRIFILILVCFFVVGCSKKDSTSKTKEDVLKDIDSKQIVEINENLFIESINDIYLNLDNYRDKYIIIEGLYAKEKNQNRYYHLIMRWGPGCCVDDEKAGFQLEYDGNYPNENDWIRVIGKIKTFMESGYESVKIEVLSLEVKTERGKEIVERQ